MKPFEYYSQNTKTFYPNKSDYTIVYVYDKGRLIWEGNPESFKGQVFNKDVVTQRVLNEVEYKEHLRVYNQETSKLHDEFMQDLFEEFSVTTHPKRHKMFNYAWDKGHAFGFSDVYSQFGDIVELVVND